MFELQLPLLLCCFICFSYLDALKMPSYRSQSRSPNPPVPATPCIPASRTPTFQPPSYYAAAAAGLPIPTPSTQVSRSEESSYHSSHSPYGVPLSYPTQPTAGRADHANDLAGGSSNGSASRSRSSSISRTLHRAKSGRGEKEKSEVKEKGSENARASQFVDLPLLETQLLPSLRDTIDRMTHPQTHSQNHRQSRLDDLYDNRPHASNPAYIEHSPHAPTQSSLHSPRYRSPDVGRGEHEVSSPNYQSLRVPPVVVPASQKAPVLSPREVHYTQEQDDLSQFTRTGSQTPRTSKKTRLPTPSPTVATPSYQSARTTQHRMPELGLSEETQAPPSVSIHLGYFLEYASDEKPNSF